MTEPPLRRHVFDPDHNGECWVCDNWFSYPLHWESGMAFTPEQIAELRKVVADGAGHECSEWRAAGKCQLCDRLLPDDDHAGTAVPFDPEEV